ncbi:hypothetical protein GCM10022224_019190 [Nonomuraea antimicrobica]|uniref:Uncharacterized protein n=1 Tax=Nonomuraea antimicrobica TaxID=561173 RepID=A0ABP7BDW1_9ACTN
MWTMAAEDEWILADRLAKGLRDQAMAVGVVYPIVLRSRITPLSRSAHHNPPARSAWLMTCGNLPAKHIRTESHEKPLNSALSTGLFVRMLVMPRSSPNVGAVGHTTGGGAGLLGRRFGFAADHVRRLHLAILRRLPVVTRRPTLLAGRPWRQSTTADAASSLPMVSRHWPFRSFSRAFSVAQATSVGRLAEPAGEVVVQVLLIVADPGDVAVGA